MTAEHLFVNGLERWGARPCLISSQGEVLSYAALAARADALAAGLGDGRQLVFIEARNSVASIAAYIGCLRAGHVVHLIDPERGHENDALVRTYRPNAVIRCAEGGAGIEQLHPDQLPLHPELAVLLATSGSTGSRKLVKLSRRNIESNTASIVEYLGLEPADRAITTLKFHYSYGLSIVNTHLAVGASLVLTSLSLHEPALMALCRDQGVTSLSGVPHHFEMLDRMQGRLDSLASLRYVTQAGGRLAPELVVRYAALGRAQGWKFFVMYGQTEAAPRISYLPPRLAEANPDSIGIPVPGGAMFVQTPDGQRHQTPGVEGELVYTGPNVMMGYALSWTDLASDEQLQQLLTGDLVVMDHQGLFRITGRMSRFVKPFGLRINLDEVEAHLRSLGHMVAVVATAGEHIAVFCQGVADAAPRLTYLLCAKYGLPRFAFEVVVVDAIPLLPSGKFDYRRMAGLVAQHSGASALTGDRRKAVSFITTTMREFVGILVGNGSSWQSLEEMFAFYFPHQVLKDDASFQSLGGDSLLYVEMSVALEDFLGQLPRDWYSKTLHELKLLYLE